MLCCPSYCLMQRSAPGSPVLPAQLTTTLTASLLSAHQRPGIICVLLVVGWAMLLSHPSLGSSVCVDDLSCHTTANDICACV